MLKPWQRGVCYVAIYAWIVLLFLAVALRSQEIAPPSDPHSVDHCDMPARAAKNGAHPCLCVKFVSQVQDAYGRMCWIKAGFLTPPRVPIPMHLLPPDVAGCMKAAPNHCSSIAHGVDYWQRRTGETVDDVPPAGPAYNRCATSCRPERCGCVDGSCAKHGETEEY